MEENIYCCQCGKILFINNTINYDNKYTQICSDCQNEKFIVKTEVNNNASLDSNRTWWEFMGKS